MSEELTTLDALLTGFLGGAALGLVITIVRIACDRFARLGVVALFARCRRRAPR